MFPRRKWDSPNPSLASECALPPRTGGRGAHSVRGRGSPNSDDWRKSLAHCLLCGTACRYLSGAPCSQQAVRSPMLRQLPLTVPQEGGDVFIPLKSDWPYSMGPSDICIMAPFWFTCFQVKFKRCSVHSAENAESAKNARTAH
jgi:hypothetical protein